MAAYDPSARPNAMRTKYMVKTSGDRWFIPYNDNGTRAEQLAQCKNQVGKTTNLSTEAGVETVV